LRQDLGEVLVREVPDVRTGVALQRNRQNLLALKHAFRHFRLHIPRPGNGLVSMLIQWDVPTHPAARLPKSNVTLAPLAGTHPEPAPLRAALAAPGLEGVTSISYDRETRLAAMLRTPRGMVTL